jgi:hypothetical protein
VAPPGRPGELCGRQLRASLIDVKNVLDDMARCRKPVVDLTAKQD